MGSLCLNRRHVEAIVLGRGLVRVTVYKVGDNVRLAVEAPKSMAVHREEVAAAVETKPQPVAGLLCVDRERKTITIAVDDLQQLEESLRDGFIQFNGGRC